MKLFDEIICETRSLFSSCNIVFTEFSPDSAWADVGHNQMIMERDTFASFDGLGFDLVTEENVKNGVFLVGGDIKSCKKNTDFLRVTVVEIQPQEDDQKLYDLLKKIEYVKYHYYPDGYMLRTSSTSQNESVRVSKKAVRDNISFEKIGNLLISQYKKIQGVKSVSVYFVTSPIDKKKAKAIADKKREIADALNHIMRDVNFDCASCGLKSICDEVEGLREMHFKNAERM